MPKGNRIYLVIVHGNGYIENPDCVIEQVGKVESAYEPRGLTRLELIPVLD